VQNAFIHKRSDQKPSRWLNPLAKGFYSPLALEFKTIRFIYNVCRNGINRVAQQGFATIALRSDNRYPSTMKIAQNVVSVIVCSWDIVCRKRTRERIISRLSSHDEAVRARGIEQLKPFF
jgi:hypothetical protein